MAEADLCRIEAGDWWWTCGAELLSCFGWEFGVKFAGEGSYVATIEYIEGLRQANESHLLEPLLKTSHTGLLYFLCNRPAMVIPAYLHRRWTAAGEYDTSDIRHQPL